MTHTEMCRFLLAQVPHLCECSNAARTAQHCMFHRGETMYSLASEAVQAKYGTLLESLPLEVLSVLDTYELGLIVTQERYLFETPFGVLEYIDPEGD